MVSTVHTKNTETFPAPQCPSPLCLFLNPWFCNWWHRYPPCCCLVTLIDAINQTPWFAVAVRGYKMKTGSAHLPSTFSYCYADLAGWFWDSSNAGDSSVCFPQGFHICLHPKMWWGELLKTNCKTLQTAPLLPSVLQESLRVGIAVANPGSSCRLSHLSAGFVPLAEGDPPWSERADLTVLWWKPCWSLLMSTSPLDGPCREWHHCSGVLQQCLPTLTEPVQDLCSLGAEPGPSTPAQARWAVGWGEDREWCALLHIPCLSHSSSAALPSRGAGSSSHLQVLQVQFGNCSLDVS